MFHLESSPSRILSTSNDRTDQSSGYSSLILLTKELVARSQRLKCRPARAIRDCGSSGLKISIFSSATYRTLLSSTLILVSQKASKKDGHELTEHDRNFDVVPSVIRVPACESAIVHRQHIRCPSLLLRLCNCIFCV